jgi:hypothetical protein
MNLITSTYPGTFHEVGYLLARLERRPWFLAQRGEEIGITPELLVGDDKISTYEPETSL